VSRGKKKSVLVPVREPNGRLRRPTAQAINAVSPAVLKRMRDAALIGLRDQEWGTELGRLFLQDEIEPYEYAAGKRWGSLVEAYHRATGAPPFKSMTFDRKPRSAEVDPESEEGEKQADVDRAIVEDMTEAHAVLMSAGMRAERAVRAICEERETSVGVVGLDNLRNGLRWLADHWELTQKAKQSTSVRRAS
jgi:hypothetical protein